MARFAGHCPFHQLSGGVHTCHRVYSGDLRNRSFRREGTSGTVWAGIRKILRRGSEVFPKEVNGVGPQILRWVNPRSKIKILKAITQRTAGTPSPRRYRREPRLKLETGTNGIPPSHKPPSLKLWRSRATVDKQDVNCGHLRQGFKYPQYQGPDDLQ